MNSGRGVGGGGGGVGVGVGSLGGGVGVFGLGGFGGGALDISFLMGFRGAVGCFFFGASTTGSGVTTFG